MFSIYCGGPEGREGRETAWEGIPTGLYYVPWLCRPMYENVRKLVSKCRAEMKWYERVRACGYGWKCVRELATA